MTANLVLSSPFPSSSPSIRSYTSSTHWNHRSAPHSLLSPITKPSHPRPPRFSRRVRASPTSAMEAKHSQTTDISTASAPPMKLLFVEMGVGYDQHGQDITAAAMRACRDAISSNSIPAFRRGSIPGVSFEQMKLQIKLGVPHSLQRSLDVEKVKSVFPYGKILNVEVVDGGLICSSGVHVEEMGDTNDDCYIVNAAVYVGY